MNRFSIHLLAFGIVLLCVSSSNIFSAEPSPRKSSSPAGIKAKTQAGTPVRMILFDTMGGVVPTPEFVAANYPWIEKERGFFDGMFIRFKSSFRVMKAAPLDYNTAAADVAPLKGLRFTALKHNFAMVYNDSAADVFDDWSVVIKNWATFARTAKEAGFEGIFFDNEEYFKHWTNYPDYCKYPEKSLKEYQDQVRLRGKQVMQSVAAEWPNVVVITAHGPSVSEPKAPASVFPQWQFANELKGPFFVGFLEGMGEQALNVDGGELYTLRTPEEFEAAYQFQKFGIASDATDCAFIPPDLRKSYGSRISASYGVYNQPFRGKTMDAAQFGETALNALIRADHYIWIYPEKTTFLKPDGIGQDWVDAMRKAKETYLNTLPGVRF